MQTYMQALQENMPPLQTFIRAMPTACAVLQTSLHALQDAYPDYLVIVWASKPTTLRADLLNSTPIRCTSEPWPRYFSG